MLVKHQKIIEAIRQIRDNGGVLDRIAVELNRDAMGGRGIGFRKASRKLDEAMGLLGEAADDIEVTANRMELEKRLTRGDVMEMAGDEFEVRPPTIFERLTRRIRGVEKEPDHVRHRTVQFEFTHNDDDDSIHTQAPDVEQLEREELVALFLTISLLIKEKFEVTLPEVAELVFLAGQQLPPRFQVIQGGIADTEEE